MRKVENQLTKKEKVAIVIFRFETKMFQFIV